MKKYSPGFILTEIVVLLVFCCIPTVFVALFTDPEKNLTIPSLMIFMFGAFILHTALANRVLFPIIRKKMEEKTLEEGIVRSQTFYNIQGNSCASILVIDEMHAKIAYISVHNPFQFQTADVKDLSDVGSGYIKGPLFDATRYVYYQFTYKGKRMMIPTFTARNMHFLTATGVQDAIAKADHFRDSIQAIQKKEDQDIG